MPNLQYILDVILNDTGAKKDITAIEAELKKLKDFGETGIRVVLDKDGNAIRVLSQLKNQTGAVVDYVREWDEKTQQLVQKTSTLGINYEKAAKEQVRAAKEIEQANNAMIATMLQAQMRKKQAVEEEYQAQVKLLEFERDSLIEQAKADAEATQASQKKSAELEKQKADYQQLIILSQLYTQELQRQAEARERQENNQMIAAMLQAQMRKKQAVEEEYEENRRLLEQEHQLEVESIRRWDAQQRQADAQAEANRQSIRDYQQLILFAQIYEKEVKNTTNMAASLYAKGDMQGYDAAIQHLKDLGVAVDEAAIKEKALQMAAQGAGDATEKAGKKTDEAADRANKANKAFGLLHTVFLRLAHTAISAVTRAFREALTEMKNVDSELVVVRKVSDASVEELAVLKDRAYEVGAAYGVLASDYLNAAAEMTRAGYREQAGDLAELATKLQLVGDVSQDTANQFLIATDKSYKMGGNFQKLSATIDKLNEIDNNFATSFEKVADGIGLLAPVAAQANVSFDEMAAAIGTVTAVTQRSGTESARALRSLFLNIIRDTDTEIEDGVTWTVEEINSVSDALKKYAPEVVKAADATGELINPMEAVGALAKSYKEGLLTNQDLFEIVSGLGGKLRTSQLLALIQNWDMYNQMLEKTANAAGSADKEVSNALDSWDRKLQQLKNTFTQFTQSLLETDEIKGFIDSFRYLIESINDPDSAGKFSETFNKALNSLVKKLPYYQDAINRFAITVVKGFISALKDELPTILKELADGARRVTDDLVKELPNILSNFISAIVEIIVESIADSSLAFDLASSIIAGIIKAIPTVLTNSFESLIDAIEFGFSGKDVGGIVKEILSATGLSALSIPVDVVVKIANSKENGGQQNPKLYIDDNPIGNSWSVTWEDDITESTNELADSVKSLSDELDTATKSLDKYKKALEGGEKGDALKSYSEAYKKAVEMYEKGLTGSNQYMSAIDLLFGNVDDYEAAGELLGNAFVKAMFAGGGDDFGAAAANWIRKNIDNLKGVALKEGEDGTFGLDFFDVDAFAEQMQVSADAVWILIDALDAYNSKKTYTRDELLDFMGAGDEKWAEQLVHIVDLSEVINNLAGQGKSAREIKNIVDAIKELAATDGDIKIKEPEDLDQTIKDIVELNKEAEKGKDMEVVLTSNSDEFFDGINKQIEQLDGTVIYIGIKSNVDYSGTHGGHGGKHSGSVIRHGEITGGYGGTIIQTMFPYASGTKSARGGLSLVNEEGAELIYANGKAWIAGGGDPAITNLPAGAGVFTAKETREILTRSGIESHRGTYVGGIPINDIIASGGSGKSGSGKLTESLLEQIAEYINDILKKAKEALQEQLDAIDEQIEKLKREHDAEEDANKLEELRLKILEAEKKLAEAEQERTVRYFNKETGQWEWMADQKAVADAQKELQDARDAYDKEVAEQAYQAQLQALEDQKDSLNDAYNELSDGWEKIYEELENILNEKGAVDIAKLLATLLGTQGGGYAPDIQALIDAIGAFTANPTSVLDTDTTERIMSLNSSSGGATPVLSAMLGSGSYDLNGRGQSTLGGNTSIVGDTIYYINGVQIGSDMMDKPLSQILSVLPIYAN